MVNLVSSLRLLQRFKINICTKWALYAFQIIVQPVKGLMESLYKLFKI